jgi:serine/threonine protein kinase
MGQLFGGNYELTAAVGRGPTGTVWQAQDRGTHEVCAVKVLDAQFADDPATVGRFVRERHVLNAFLHPVLVRTRELVADGRDLGLVVELVAGGSLRHHVGQSGAFAPDVAADIAAICAHALAAAHAVGVVHCDIKPSNVLLASGSEDVRITDCRVSRLARGRREGVARFSDPRYAAPEVIHGGPPISATDVYGLGLVLYEMLIGEPLCQGDDPAYLLRQHLRGRPVVPTVMARPLRDLLESSLALDPGDRPSATEVAEELDLLVPALRGEPLRSYPVERSDRPGELWDRPAEGTAPAQLPAVREPDPAAHSHSAFRPAALGRTRQRRPVSRPLLIVGAVLVIAALVAFIIASLPAADGSQRTDTASAKPSSGGSAPVAGAVTPPVQAADARSPNVDGAKAFAQYWFATLSYAVATGKTDPLVRASSPNCAVCKTALDNVHNGYSNGRKIRGGTYTVRIVTTDSFFSLEQPKVTVVFDRVPRSTVSSTGQQIETLPGTTFANVVVLLERTADNWRVREVQSPSPVV